MRAGWCGLVRAIAVSASRSARQMTGQDRSHERVSGLRTGGHRPDLLVDALGRHTCAVTVHSAALLPHDLDL